MIGVPVLELWYGRSIWRKGEKLVHLHPHESELHLTHPQVIAELGLKSTTDAIGWEMMIFRPEFYEVMRVYMEVAGYPNDVRVLILLLLIRHCADGADINFSYLVDILSQEFDTLRIENMDFGQRSAINYRRYINNMFRVYGGDIETNFPTWTHKSALNDTGWCYGKDTISRCEKVFISSVL